MKIIIYNLLLFTFVIFLNSVHSMYPKPHGNKYVTINGVKHTVPYGGRPVYSDNGVFIPDVDNSEEVFPRHNNILQRSLQPVGRYEGQGSRQVLKKLNPAHPDGRLEPMGFDILIHEGIERAVYEEGFGFRALKRVAGPQRGHGWVRQDT
ncbi:uncharacterized protein LOC117178498 [Belonocnema kinseyi]|uniref:uncharacterized protein LOC117178498 n=1 Tax=Belonocnema kinseyi TaxID=2817044 RepID=UPI00143D381C|nr:uncharacterized protein LOC117178498 [Belonocnema kinseyi]